MSTPRTVVAPPQTSRRGGALLTSADRQGSAAIEQQLILDLLGDRNTKNPWANGRPGLHDSIFAASDQATLQVEAHVRSLFVRYETMERARLAGLAFERGTGDEEGRLFLLLDWYNLRLSRDRQQRSSLRLELTP